MEGRPIVSLIITVFVTFLLAFFLFNVPKRKYDAWTKHQFRNVTMSSNFEDKRDLLPLTDFKVVMNTLSEREQKRLEFITNADRSK
jgi:uncharacterized protein YacL